MIKENHLRIGIILGSTREGRVSPQVGEWIKANAESRQDAVYEIVDIKTYQLPLLGESNNLEGVNRWNEKIASLDGFVFIVPEYNHGMTGVLKNALDSAYEAWNNKPAGLVSYGSALGSRAAEQVRLVLGELQVADVRAQVLLSLFTDFIDGVEFNPHKRHLKNLNTMLDQLTRWAEAFQSIRNQ
ncbi:MAG: NAD(P)H-dependent oxidoreductase [Candidatus Izemoplasmatales bacterium]|jgi:NAD(P)H-dependent FMN reductase|nr:NAD(P)H-dependent oxidoreductase [Candidatus Izemoplasmatales bacterium]MDD4354791.1 NAD(P)H-dependent oxidoreductase [Candidatus Izemoplasmatales bacterium]MDD4987974.1 NAD(P)H-dependent oxidoreductase [Candidatus Izemoplasmatales bacterium]MDY0372933.1 NAD(P)H-dependent oxidoreductase [Candidatus Izemoplasmatales bacterium]NLF48381.1 NAD(P)H-dependent oxidoreductase [Acholeplasmataceae bacterium]